MNKKVYKPKKKYKYSSKSNFFKKKTLPTLLLAISLLIVGAISIFAHTFSSSTNFEIHANSQQTVTFDNLTPTETLNGQYPNGIINWSSGEWIVYAATSNLHTPSIGYSRQKRGGNSASFEFIVPHRLISVMIENTDNKAANVTISCNGLTNVTKKVGGKQKTLVKTGWTTNCSTVTFASNNGTGTLFDDLVIDVVIPKPTASPTSAPTSTPAPTATPINSPTPSPTPSPTSQPISSVHGVPLCTDHDSTKWHPLVKRNSDGSVNCTYGHDHKMDPKQLDHIFGSVGQYTGGQEISYPWQTTSALGYENDAKHRSYDWEVVTTSECKPSFAQYGFDAVRRQTHADGIGGSSVNDPTGASVRFHSFFLQARTCDPKDANYHGSVTIGGLMDTSTLFAGPIPNPNDNYIPLPGDPDQPRNGRFHMYANPDGTLPTQPRNGDFTWYYHNCTVVNPNSKCIVTEGGVRKEDWGGIDPANPFKVLIANPNNLNGSYIEKVHLVALQIPSHLDLVDGKQDGLVNLNGYTDRYGNIMSGCTAIGADCIPVSLTNIKVGSYQFRADTNNIGVYETDVKASNGQSLIVFPN